MGATATSVDKVIRCDCTPAAAFAAFDGEDLLAQWLAADVVIDPRTGGVIEVAVDAWPLMAGELVEFRPPHRLVVEWHTGTNAALRTTIDVARIDPGPGTSIHINETGFGEDEDLAREREYLWTHWAGRLSAVLGMLSGH